MHVIKRDGKKQTIHFDKITERLLKLANKEPKLNHIDPVVIAQKVVAGVYPGITTTELDELSSEISVFMSTIHPEYETMAARITISNLHKETLADYGQLCDRMYSYIHPKTNEHAPLLTKPCYAFIKKHLDIIQRAINYEKDYTYEYFGIKTLQRSYLLKMNGQIVERVQQMLMRVSVGIHASVLHLDDTITEVLKTYQLLSDKCYTLATPTLFNAGTSHSQLSSCFLLTMKDDSIDGIYDTIKRTALISKGAGGIGLAVHNIRGKNSYIKSTNGTSDGLVPMLRVFNETARYVNQAGKRKGSIAIYLEPHHVDVEDFLELMKKHGKEELRCRDLFYAIWASDLFMKRVENDADWSLFCPNECPGLEELYGSEFEELYERYERDGKARKVIKARQLWMQMMVSQIETGVPYLCYKDTANKHNNQSNLGTLKSSNLCTEIYEYTSSDEVSVCNLASISLPKCVVDGQFNHQVLYDIAYQAIRDLNKVIDSNLYPIAEAKNSNLKHRPVGLGVQGLQDAFFLLRLPYDSTEAQKLNEEIFETIYYAAARSSCDLAQQFGPYASFVGSPASMGQLCPDLWQKVPSARWNYPELRKDIVKFGLRNSLLCCAQPTASTSNILGNTECIEPITSNIYARRVLAGEFTMINKYLIADLIKLGLWNERIKTKIVANGGSVQNIKEIPTDLQLLYRTIWEIPLKNQAEMNAARQRFVDQGISFNVFMAAPSKQKLTSFHFFQHKIGIKTSSYYIRTRPAVDAIQFTVDKELLIDVESVEMYTKPNCKFCLLAKQLLDDKGIKYTTYDITDKNIKKELEARAPNTTTVPQIFIHQQLVGGYDSLKKLEDQQLLNQVLDKTLRLSQTESEEPMCLMCSS